MCLSKAEILAWLREDDQLRLAKLWRLADTIRAGSVGDEVHLRGLIEFSNECRRSCLYCGLRAPNRRLARYRMTRDEILACAAKAHARGYGTVVLQSGHHEGVTATWLGEVISAIKERMGLAVTLSVGERSPADLRHWRDCGADRYLLRFESSDRSLLRRLRPGPQAEPVDRLALLMILRRLGYEIGSGVMVGLPGQTYASLAQDIALFATLDLDMVGVGTYIPHPGTPLGRFFRTRGRVSEDQVPNNDLATLKVMALTRLVCPEANIPATTALATIDTHGYEKGLATGANVIMPILTPPTYRRLYEIYPSSVRDEAEGVEKRIAGIIGAMGRRPGRGRGNRVHLAARLTARTAG